MIIDEIILDNYKVFRGEQKAVLTPPSHKRRIVLFGGLNGAGKTTILESLQLALYGKLAPFLQDISCGYHEHLRRSIHRKINPRDGASVEISFRSVEQGQEHIYRVHRVWSCHNKSVSEFVDVYQDGKYDPVLSETWTEQVERFIPVRLSHLFLFDGERIESLANPKKSAGLLSSAINSLLGIDLVEKLRNDLLVLSRRKSREIKEETDRKMIDKLEIELEGLNDSIDNLKQKAGGLRNIFDRKINEFAEFENKFIQAGGQLCERRGEFEYEKAELEDKIKATKESLVEISSGSLPLCLVTDFLEEIRSQAQLEEKALQAKSLISFLSKRDKRLIKSLKKIGADQKVLSVIERFITEEHRKHASELNVDSYLNINADSRQQLEVLLAGILKKENNKADKLLKDLEQFETLLDNVERKLAIVPDTDSLKKLNEERKKKQKELQNLKIQLSAIKREIENLEFQRSECARKLDKMIQLSNELYLENEDTHRLLKHASRVRETLADFRIAITRNHLSQLEQYILDGYKALLRKQSLVAKIEITPEDCVLNIFNKDSKSIRPDQISAGERQLLAVSMLWGLGKASGQPLPVAIDTPLGRLDSSHRHFLVQRYFPHASHQVILLSTDEEIDKEHYKTLEPYIGHAYHIEYEEEYESSSITPGYFS